MGPIGDPVPHPVTDRQDTPVPLELTRFVGRDAEIEELARLVGSGRLLTLTGAGGSGKTRLAYELLRSARFRPQAPVVLVELAALADPNLLPRQIAEAFDIREEVGADPAALVELLRGRTALLVLDNCEHLVEAVAEVVDAILRTCAGISVLATSREALGVKGERAWPVPALGLPDPSALPEQVAESEAVRLFVDRARDVAADFAITPDNAAAVAGICRRLDGMPLAIELAAARVRVLTPEQIHDRLADAFRLLTRGGRTSVPRHRTLRAAIDWSHDLLPPDARVLLRRLGVFRGEFTLDGVEAVGADATLPGPDVLDTLEQLAGRSLVVVHENAAGEARYSLLETVRQYATLRLMESGEESATRQRHAHYVLSIVEDVEPDLTTTARRAAVERLNADLENIREALHWTVENDAPTHIGLVGALWWYWFSTRHWSEAGRWIDGAIALPDAGRPGMPRAKLLFAAGALAALQTRCDDAAPALHEAAELAGAAGDDRLLAYAHNYLGLTYGQSGNAEGRVWAERAQQWFRENADLYGLRLNLLVLASIAQFQGRLDDAERLNNEGIAVARRFGQDRDLAVALQNSAASHIATGHYDSAARLISESLVALRRDPSWLFIARGADLWAEVIGRSDPERAARVLGATSSIRDAIHARPFKLDRDRLDALVPRLRSTLGEARYEAAHAAGARLTIDQLVDEILAAAPAVTPPIDSATVHVTPPAEEPAAAPFEPELAAHSTPPAGRSAPSALSAAPATADIAIDALGPLRIRIAGEDVPADAWPYAKPRELLLLLALHPYGRTREQIGQALWPASTPKQAKNSFHVTLHHLRKVLGRGEWVVTEADRYRLAPDLTVDLDADRFEAHAKRALRQEDTDIETLRAVREMYRGELFAGEPQARWQEEHRDRLRRHHVDVTLRLADRLAAARDWTAAADLYHEVTLTEDLNEEAHRGLMEALASSGSRARAIRHYEKVVEIVRDALDSEPEEETRELAERLKR